MNKDDNKKTHIIVTGKGGGGGSDAGAVRFDEAQTLTSAEQLQARENIGVPTEWFGTQAEYDLIDPKDPNTTYHIEGSDNVQADWNQTDTTADDYIKNKPSIPAAQVNSDWNAASGVAQILNKPTIPTKTSELTNDSGFTTFDGDYNSLTNKPTIPAPQVQADWNANSGMGQILNKPTIPTVPAMAIEALTFTLQGGTVKTVEFYTVPNYFYVEDISGSDNTLSIKKQAGSAPVIEVFCSTDKMNWTSMGSTTTYNVPITATIPANGKLYLKANTDAFTDINITASGNYNIGGNTMSLLYGDNFEGKTVFPTNSIKLNNLFSGGTKLLSAATLLLPATTLAGGCYQNMFSGCTSLTTAPALPATTLAGGCYQNMFSGCTSLTTAPALPATTLANGCYQNMFYNCTSLTTAPALPATTLNNYCYSSMFQGCTSLTTAPALSATTLTEGCYSQMFKGCTALTTAPALPATTLPATTISGTGCYEQMFYNCTSLTTAPILPATILTRYSYKEMFRGCTSLNSVTTYAQDMTNSIGNWLYGVAATGDFYNLGSITYPSGASGIPEGWTEHTSL